jgi:uncharacterized membrane protein YccF (DUF307 family)
MIRTTSQQAVQQISFRHDRRGACSWILNILWLVLGGWQMFLTWFFTGLLICCCTCICIPFGWIGIPFGWQVIKISMFLLFPFGKTMTYTHDQFQDGGRCCVRSCNCFLNIVWAVIVGWILALQALITGILLMVTIVGIPFGWQCFKLTYLCFCPFGFDFTAEEVETIVITTAKRRSL